MDLRTGSIFLPEWNGTAGAKSFSNYVTPRKGILVPAFESFTLTPSSRGQFHPFDPYSLIGQDEVDDSFVYLRNCRQPFNRIDDTVYEAGNNWREDGAKILKYVDDFLASEKLFMGAGYTIYSQNKQVLQIHAQQSEDIFRRVKENAERIGMRVNDKRTQLLCISAQIPTCVFTFIEC